MADSAKTPDLIQIIEQFTDFIRAKAEDDEDVRENVLPLIEGLTASIQESHKFSEEYPSISNLLAFMCSTIEAHEQKLEMLKDALLEIRDHTGSHGLTPEELAAYAAYKKVDKDMLN